MKKALVLILACCLIAGLAACGVPSDDEIKAVRSVSFEGTELTVTLGTNKSSGYEWDYEIYGECVEPSINRSFKIIGSQGDSAGEVSIGFEGTKEGSAVILFTTPNGWDGTGEGDAYTVNVEVGADKTILSASGEVGVNVPEPAPKTSVSIDELKEGTYTGTMSGGEFVNNSKTIFTTIMPADLTITIEKGQVTLSCESVTSAYGMLEGVKTPQSPEGSLILSGSLTLQQSGDEVTAEGELTSLGKGFNLKHIDMEFKSWEMTERKGDGKYACTVQIAMTDGVPVATIAVDLKQFSCTATIPLALASGEEATGSAEPLSAPYAEMLKSGDYQYTYSLEYEGKPYSATIATYNGMICRKVVSEDGTFSQRVVTIDKNAWKIDDLTGAVMDGGTENGETTPDYSTLTFVNSKTLETGAIADAYDFELEGQKCNLVFLFAPEGQLVSLIATVGEETSEMDILNFSSMGDDQALFDVPQF